MSATPLERLLALVPTWRVGTEAVDAFLARPGPALLVFTGDPAQRPEAQDVAVVAAELRRLVPGLEVGVVERAGEDALRSRFEVKAVPAVVFVKDGRAVSSLARVQDWAVYARMAEVLFGRPTGVVP